MHFQVYFLLLILCYVISIIGNTHEKEDDIFSSTVFVFYDSANKLLLNNEVTSLSFWCFGSIVSDRWILTSASCFNKIEEPDPKRYIVVPSKAAIDYGKLRKAQPYPVKKIIRHDDWIVEESDGVNLALILLITPIIFEKDLQKASLSTTALKNITMCRSLAWLKEPSDISGGVMFKPQSLAGDVDIQCRPKKHYTEFCILYKIEEGACYTVQGGSLECKNKVQGIVSSRCGGTEPVCANRKTPKLLLLRYVDVGSYYTWIMSITELPEVENIQDDFEEIPNEKSGVDRVTSFVQNGIFFISLSLTYIVI